MDVGDNLASHLHVEYLVADDPKGIKDQLTQIKMPYKVIGAYAQGVKHVLVLLLSQPIKKKTVKKRSPKKGIIKTTKKLN